MDNLDEKTDEELKEIVKRNASLKRLVRESLSETIEKLWNLREQRDTLRDLGRKAKLILGTRKGENCPALIYQGNYNHYDCEARRNYRAHGRKEEILRDFCSTCYLTHEKAKTKMVWNKTFEIQR